jgi:hypothetical protein
MERFLYAYFQPNTMKRGLTIFMLALIVLLVACSQTTVVKSTTTTSSTQSPTTTTPTTPAATNTTQPSTGGASVAVNNTVTKCEDTDGNDAATIGRVRLTFADGTTQDFYDECPGEANFQSEYFCDGLNVKSKNNVCKDQCILAKVKDPACPNCKVGACMTIR